MATGVDYIQSRAQYIINPIERKAFETLVGVAVRSGDAGFVASVGQMYQLSAQGQGTGIFYSGMGPNSLRNQDNAEYVRDFVLRGNGYLWTDTPLARTIHRELRDEMMGGDEGAGWA